MPRAYWFFCLSDDLGSDELDWFIKGDSPAPVTTTAAIPDNDNDSDDGDDPEDFSEEGLKASDAVLSVSKSVVSLAASIGNFLLVPFAIKLLMCNG